MKLGSIRWQPGAVPDMVTGTAIALLSLIFLLAVVPAAIELPQDVSHDALSPRFLPVILASITGLLGFAMALRGAALQYTSAHAEVTPAGKSAVNGRSAAIAFALLVLAAIASPWAGMTGASAISTSGLLVLAGERRPWSYLLIAGLFPMAMSWLFASILHVPIPAGILFG